MFAINHAATALLVKRRYPDVLSLFFAGVPGPEGWLANRPMLITTAILAQIIVTLLAVGWTARLSRCP
jgi:hypothetical protein